jgi:hypothetical protein
MARWHAYRGETALALKAVSAMQTLAGRPIVTTMVAILESECLIRLGRADQARKVLARAIRARPRFDPDLCLAFANYIAATGGGDEARLQWINRIFLNAGHAPLAKARADEPLTMDNLAAPTARPVTDPRGPKVSVLMPVHNAAQTIVTAVAGLMNQTWTNLELIIVDDCSTDGTWDILSGLADRHGIMAIRQEQNLGAYAARNRGLEAASGELITTHDADDWSHPQKIATQVRELMARPERMGNRHYWSRATTELVFRHEYRAEQRLIATDFSSFMFRREVANRLGAWDEVRAAADSEFVARAEHIFGAAAFARILSYVPLSFGRLLSNSLTGHGPTHLRTLAHGVRRDYREAAAWWRTKDADTGRLKLPRPDGLRPFPAPLRLQPGRPAWRSYDCLVVMDFTVADDASALAMGIIRACIASGLRTAVFQWRRIARERLRSMNSVIWELASAGAIDVVSAADEVTARATIVGCPTILKESIDNPPRVSCDHVAIIVNELAREARGDMHIRYVPAEVHETARTTFGAEPQWVPASPRMGRLMALDSLHPPPSEAVWMPLLDVEKECVAPVAWRGAARPVPVVGRESHDHPGLWPTDRETLFGAYCADRPCAVRLRGGDALAAMDDCPANWTIIQTGAMPAADFLHDLDFVVHYPAEHPLDSVASSVVEAMAAGKPVILPPALEEDFGDAALYAAPDGVWSVVERFWRDERAYRDQTSKGRAFVAKYCDQRQVVDRLRAFDTSARHNPPQGIEPHRRAG